MIDRDRHDGTPESIVIFALLMRRNMHHARSLSALIRRALSMRYNAFYLSYHRSVLTNHCVETLAREMRRRIVEIITAANYDAYSISQYSTQHINVICPFPRGVTALQGLLLALIIVLSRNMKLKPCVAEADNSRLSILSMPGQVLHFVIHLRLNE